MANQGRTTSPMQPKIGLPYKTYLSFLEEAEEDVQRGSRLSRETQAPLHDYIGLCQDTERISVGEGCYRLVAPPAL